MTNSTLEKVARAIIRARHATCCKRRDFSTFVLSPLDLDLARAALQSLLPASAAMSEAMCAIAPDTPDGDFSFYDAQRVFNAAINTILTEGGEG